MDVLKLLVIYLFKSIEPNTDCLLSMGFYLIMTQLEKKDF